MKISFIVSVLGAVLSTASFAQAPPDTGQLEKSKEKIVSRLYQATYGQSERCKKAPPEIAAEFKNELTRFVEANGMLMKQLVQSPYYEPARQKFSKHDAADSARDTPEKLGGECKYLAELLRTMSDTPGGRKAVKEYEETLSK